MSPLALLPALSLSQVFQVFTCESQCLSVEVFSQPCHFLSAPQSLLFQLFSHIFVPLLSGSSGFVSAFAGAGALGPPACNSLRSMAPSFSLPVASSSASLLPWSMPSNMAPAEAPSAKGRACATSPDGAAACFAKDWPVRCGCGCGCGPKCWRRGAVLLAAWHHKGRRARLPERAVASRKDESEVQALHGSRRAFGPRVRRCRRRRRRWRGR
mmetsp:Transcript_88991/g.251148  ORF Transcript_88991/g.251148 Transcript_88991/m.251148 type:complete len:212 (+) Transcript_88991:370-1005(+)